MRINVLSGFVSGDIVKAGIVHIASIDAMTSINQQHMSLGLFLTYPLNKSPI